MQSKDKTTSAEPRQRTRTSTNRTEQLLYRNKESILGLAKGEKLQVKASLAWPRVISFLFKFGNHVSNQALDLHKQILAN